jgi:hypothetical protein
MSFYARRLSSQKEEADGSKRGDTSDPVIQGAVGGVVLCVVVNLAAKPIAEKFLQSLSRTQPGVVNRLAANRY